MHLVNRLNNICTKFTLQLESKQDIITYRLSGLKEQVVKRLTKFQKGQYVNVTYKSREQINTLINTISE